MPPDSWRATILATGSAAIGWIGWSGNILLLPVAVFFPAIWSLARTRWQATAISTAYFLAASRGLPQGVANFYSTDLWPGVVLWLIASGSFTVVHAGLWTSSSGWRKPALYLAVCLAMILPPFGIIGWAHPVTAAGVLFPAWGWWGLVAMTILLALMTTPYRSVSAITMTGLWLLSAVAWMPQNHVSHWQGVELDMGASLGRDAGLDQQEILLNIVRRFPPLTTVVLPESALGFWTPTLRRLWEGGLVGSGIIVIAGAAVIDAHGYDNVLVRVSADGSDIVYRARMPVPVSMWQPWRLVLGQSGGARAHFFASPVIDSGAQTIATLICYEQLIVWPILQSMLHNPDMIVAVGNGWWTAGTSIIEIQRMSTTAWGRLFDIPFVLSFNN